MFYNLIKIIIVWKQIETKQAGAELGQAQLKLGLDFNSISLNWTSLIAVVD